MLNPIEKFKRSILHLNRSLHHWYRLMSWCATTKHESLANIIGKGNVFLWMLLCPDIAWFIVTLSFMSMLGLYGIPLKALIFIPYDCQGISIIDPVTGSYFFKSGQCMICLAIMDSTCIAILNSLHFYEGPRSYVNNHVWERNCVSE